MQSVGNLECVRLIVEKGGDVQMGDKEGCTPLHLAARCGDMNCLRLLVEVLNILALTPIYLYIYIYIYIYIAN